MTIQIRLQYLHASEDDFDALVELRLEAMRESLEKIGRFDRERSVERFRSSFVAADTTRIFCDDTLTGFYSMARATDHLYLSHLYVKPRHRVSGDERDCRAIEQSKSAHSIGCAEGKQVECFLPEARIRSHS